ncbi:MAG: flagellar filament capping protein FliD [Brevinematia bacterium]
MKRFFLVLLLIITIPNLIIAQTKEKKVGVSEFFGTGINSDEIINKLVDAESKKGEKYQQEVSNQIIRKAILNFINRNLSELRDIAKSMYDYRSPFGNRIGISDDESLLKVIPNRGADIGEMKIKVEQMAKPDVFISDPIPLDAQLRAFKITISSGDKSFDVDFKGGTLEDLAKAINSNAKDIVSASVVKVDNETEVLRIQGKKTGKNSKIFITGDINELLRIGLLTKEKIQKSEKKLDILSLFSPTPNLVLKEKESYSQNTNYFVTKKTILEISNSINYLTIPKLPEININLMESVKVSNVEVKGGKPITTFDIFKTYTTNDLNFITIYFKDGSNLKLNINDRYMNLNLSQYEGKEIEKIVLQNNNDLTRITFYKILLYDRDEVKQLSEYEPKNYISKAQNSVMYVNGIRIEREDNEIKDVINGTIKVVGENPNKEINTRIEYDYQAITNSISNLIEKYNDVMIYLSKITKPVVDRRQLFEKPDEEKEEGSFATDLDITRLKDKLRTIAMQPYITRSTNIKLLYQIGIYTKNISTKLDFESDLWEYVRKGVLTINNEKLIQMIIENIDTVKDIFGYDTNNDNLIDTGFSYNIATLCDEYTRVNGIISLKNKQIDNIIKSNKEMYAKFQERLEEYRTSLEQKFGRMQQILRESKSKQEWFNNQVKSLKNND